MKKHILLVALLVLAGALMFAEGGTGDNGIYPKLEACKDGHWDKKSQSYVGKKTISCYVQVRRDERDDYLEIIAVTIPD